MRDLMIRNEEGQVELVVTLLLQSLGPDMDESRLRSWAGEVLSGDGAVDFLIEKEIFKADCRRTVDMVEKGYLRIDNADCLLCEGGKARLIEELDAVERSSPGPQAESADTGSTIKDSPRELGIEAPDVVPSEAAASITLAVGETLGKCLLTERIGSGASSVVFRALHKTLHIPVAVKVLRAEGARRERVKRFFQHEARLLARLSHPGILRILDFEATDSLVYLVLEYVDGMSFSELIAQSEVVSASSVLRIGESISDALEHASSQGIIHRDVKPANILLDKSGRARLADLGVAALASSINRLSGSGDDVAGTLAYMAPEQLEPDTSVDWRADVFSLGATLYQALTGVTPYRARNPVALVIEHRDRRPPAPHELDPGIPPGLSRLIHQMIQVDPRRRGRSWAELRDAFRDLRSQDTIRRDSSVRRSTRFETASALIMSGELAGDGLTQILQFLAFNNRSGTLFVTSPLVGDAGLTLRDSAVLHAWFDGLEGIDAFHRLLSLSDGQFAFSRELDVAGVTINQPVVSLLLDQARKTDEQGQS